MGTALVTSRRRKGSFFPSKETVAQPRVLAGGGGGGLSASGQTQKYPAGPPRRRKRRTVPRPGCAVHPAQSRTCASLTRPFLAGPATWHQSFPTAAGESQSPIDIKTAGVHCDDSLCAIHATYSDVAVSALENTGSSWKAQVAGGESSEFPSPIPAALPGRGSL